MRKYQHTHLWIQPCKRPSDCASRKSLQSARGNTDRAEGGQAGFTALGRISPRELASSLGVPGPVYMIFRDPCPPFPSCCIHKGVAGPHLAYLQQPFLLVAHLSELTFWNFMTVLANLVSWEQRLQGEPGLMKPLPTCCCLDEVICQALS